jgi:hypothetical protein
VEIGPLVDPIHVGSTTTVSALGSYADGHTAPVMATWSSDNTAVATIDAGGRLTAIRLGRAGITAAFESMTASTEIIVTPAPGASWSGDFSGTWTGDSTEVSCTRLSGPGPSPCEGQERGGGRFPTTFVIHQNASAVTAGATVNIFSGTLEGWVDDSGHLYLTGQLSEGEGGTSRLRDADFTISPAGTLVGTYSWTRTFTNAFGAQILRQDWRLLDLTRSR